MLSVEALARIDRELAKYPPDRKRSGVMAALAVAQDEHGHLSPELIDFVAQYLDMPSIAVYEVASFYAMYDLEPLGKYKLALCTNLPCALAGASEAAQHLRRCLQVQFGETTPDGLFTLREGECFGACGDAPVMLVNNKRMLTGMTPEKIDRWLADARKEPER
ncbi:MAG TPA: NADH-quinone oxidoreductase subunit NuoE [Burkholderiales bacterium]|nr:NADH-quinone oxidoreductase subunit NuoE [Burkholderiales bacterium]